MERGFVYPQGWSRKARYSALRSRSKKSNKMAPGTVRTRAVIDATWSAYPKLAVYIQTANVVMKGAPANKAPVNSLRE